LGDISLEPQAPQACGRQNDRIVVTFAKALDACGDVTPQLELLHIWPGAREKRPPAQTARSYACPGGKLGKEKAVAADEGVARILASERCRECDSVFEHRRQ